MFNINLANTRAGQDMIEMGKFILARENIIDALQERFGNCPEVIVQNLEKITDLKQLKFLLIQAIRCENLGSFQSLLKED